MGNKKNAQSKASACCQCGVFRFCKYRIPGKGPACDPCRRVHYSSKRDDVRKNMLVMATLSSVVVEEDADHGRVVIDNQVTSHFALIDILIVYACKF